MDFSFSDSQTLLVDAAAAFLSDRMPLGVLQGTALGNPAPDLWPQMAELGWPGLTIPEELGGAGAGMVEVVLLMEQLGYHAAMTPFVTSAVVGTDLIVAGSKHPGRAERLQALARGERILAVAIAEDSGEFAPAAVEVHAEVGEALRGRKRFVKDADAAAEILVIVRDRAGLGVVVLPRAELGLSPMHTLSGERLFEVNLEGVIVRSSHLLFEPGGAGAHLALALAKGQVARAAEMVGLAQRVFDICVEYAKVREQSGQPIGAFQAIQHSCADMLRDVEGARYLTYRAGLSLASNRDGLSLGGTTPEAHPVGAAAMAKAYTSDVCLSVARRAHQVMGAIGYCEEHPLHLLHKRIQAAALDFGDTTEHLDSVASALGLESGPARAGAAGH